MKCAEDVLHISGETSILWNLPGNPTPNYSFGVAWGHTVDEVPRSAPVDDDDDDAGSKGKQKKPAPKKKKN